MLACLVTWIKDIGNPKVKYIYLNNIITKHQQLLHVSVHFFSDIIETSSLPFPLFRNLSINANTKNVCNKTSSRNTLLLFCTYRIRTALSNQNSRTFQGQFLSFEGLKITDVGSAMFSWIHICDPLHRNCMRQATLHNLKVWKWGSKHSHWGWP